MLISLALLKVMSWFFVFFFIAYQGVMNLGLLIKDVSVGLTLDIVKKFGESAENTARMAYDVLSQIIGLLAASLFRVDDHTLKMLLEGNFKKMQYHDFNLNLPSINSAIGRLEKLATRIEKLVLYTAIIAKWLIIAGVAAQGLNFVKAAIVPFGGFWADKVNTIGVFFFCVLFLVLLISWAIQDNFRSESQIRRLS